MFRYFFIKLRFLRSNIELLIMAKVIMKDGADVKKPILIFLVMILLFFFSAYLNLIFGLNLAFEILFDLSFLGMIIFGIVIIVAIKSGSITITENGIELKWFRKKFITWNEIQSVDLKASSLYYLPGNKSLQVRYSVEIVTNDGKTYELSVRRPKEIVEKINELRSIK